MDDYVSKPISFVALRAALAKVKEGSTPHQLVS
jgi:DNA-binding response OmpR family regulator